jgi:hypothetical protein
MENHFTIISYDDNDILLIKNTKCTIPIIKKDYVNEEEKINVNEQEKINVNEEEKINVNEEEKINVNEEEVNIDMNEEEKINVNEEEVNIDMNEDVHVIISHIMNIDITNKNIIENSSDKIIITFTNDNTVLIINNELSIPFNITFAKNAVDEYYEEKVDSINFIKEITHKNITYTIKVNSNKYRNFIITDDKYMKNVDEYYDFIDKYINRDKKVLTHELILKKVKFNELIIKINMTVTDIENFIDELSDEIDFNNLQFDIENWKKKDYIILRTLHDLLVALFHNIIKDFNNLEKNKQIQIAKQLISMYIKYHDNIKFMQKCSFGNNNIYITIIMKVFEFYTKEHIFESILCFIKYAPEYCNKNYFPVPSNGKINIDAIHEEEILNNKYLKDIYLENKNYLV